jgi:hypothetical protein
MLRAGFAGATDCAALLQKEELEASFEVMTTLRAMISTA